MIRRFFCALGAMLLLCSGALCENGDLVRLHVVAAGNHPAQQALKMEIRNTCLDCARLCLHDAPNAHAAYMRLTEHIDDFAAACEKRARELGYGGGITAQAGIFPFPDRIYGDVLVPAGNYPALRITIGEGKGRNWWCVLYPGLCSLDESALQDPHSILSWIKRCFGGD